MGITQQNIPAIPHRHQAISVPPHPNFSVSAPNRILAAALPRWVRAFNTPVAVDTFPSPRKCMGSKLTNNVFTPVIMLVTTANTAILPGRESPVIIKAMHKTEIDAAYQELGSVIFFPYALKYVIFWINVICIHTIIQCGNKWTHAITPFSFFLSKLYNNLLTVP